MQRTFFFKAAFLNFSAFPRSSFPRSTSITAPGDNIKLKSAATRIRSGLTVDVVLYPPHNLALHLDQVVAVDEHAVNLKTNQLTSLSRHRNVDSIFHLSNGSLQFEEVRMSVLDGLELFLGCRRLLEDCRTEDTDIP